MSDEEMTNDEEKRLNEALALINRKLRHEQQNQLQILNTSKINASKKVQDGILESIQNGKVGHARITIPISAFSEIVSCATSITRDWPVTVWQIISSILRKTQPIIHDSSVLINIVDMYTWRPGQNPFTLKYVNSDKFREMVIQSAKRYGFSQDEAFNAFDRRLNLENGKAQCVILNVARQVRESVSIEIDEFMLAPYQDSNPNNSVTPSNSDETVKISKKPKTSPEIIAECLPVTRKYKNEWFLAIKDTVLAFYKAHGRCPNRAEAWVRLRNTPPPGYDITVGKDRGEDAVFMGGNSLGKRAFDVRWTRYTKK